MVERFDLDRQPSPAILAGGICGDNLSHYWLEGEIVPGKDRTFKPPYQLPSMADIEQVPWNGFRAISTFSGAGGSCLGLRMAGFKVLWANEFVPAAQEVYRLNHPGSILDTRDIRQVTAAEILDAIGLGQGDLDLMDGSPPCASFSVIGHREKDWGKVKAYSDTQQRTDDLFWEYARLVKGIRPKVFLAENVPGLVRGKAKGYFLQILALLKDCGYRVKVVKLDAQWLGVPQSRERLFFQGIRDDLDVDHAWPSPLPYYYTVADALAGTVRAIEDTGGSWGMGDFTSRPAPTVRQAGPGHLYIERDQDQAGQPTSPRRRKFTIPEVMAICSFPADFQLTGSYNKRWERLGRAVPPPYDVPSCIGDQGPGPGQGGCLMCGIVGGFRSEKATLQGMAALVHRGPDGQGLVKSGSAFLGATRLAILDPLPRSDQPFHRDGLDLVYNGELWNCAQIKAELLELGHQFRTTGDTEIIAAALNEWGLDALPKFDGMFAMAWSWADGQVFVARDIFGEIPVHISQQQPFCFASEIKALLAMGCHPRSVSWVQPGYVVSAHKDGMIARPFAEIQPGRLPDDLVQASVQVKTLVKDGVLARTLSDVPVCCLISGGIDSSAVLWHLVQHFRDVTAYTAVYNPHSKDLAAARHICGQLGVHLKEIPVPCPGRDDLARVVQIIEMPHKAQVEIGWPCLHLAKAMAQDGFKVTYSGEGSDELWASYGFSYHGVISSGWHAYRRGLFLGQHRKNFARANKAFMAYGVECRLPFLSQGLVQYALGLSRAAVRGPAEHEKEKAVLSLAYRGILPDHICERPKLAFQDGMGIKAAIRNRLPSPARFYRAEFIRAFSGVQA